MSHGRYRPWRAPVLWMLAAAAGLAVMLAEAHLRGDYDPAGQRRMANYHGDPTDFLRLGAVELLVLALLLRP